MSRFSFDKHKEYSHLDDREPLSVSSRAHAVERTEDGPQRADRPLPQRSLALSAAIDGARTVAITNERPFVWRSPMRRILVLLLLTFAAACSDALDPAGPSASPGGTANLLAAGQDPTPDQLAVAQAVPGFGGYYIDSGKPTVWLTDPSQRPAAEQALAGFLTSFGWSAADLQVRQATYTYAQLDGWYRQSWRAALAVPGAVITDLDEGSNRLRFGGVDAAAVANIASTLAGLNVPAAATVVEVRAPVVTAATLRDRHRPALGGVQINFFPVQASPLTLVCTLGFNARLNGVNSFITNSHCGYVQGGNETPTEFYQPSIQSGGLTGIPNTPTGDPAAHIATEVHDPHYWISLDCPV